MSAATATPAKPKSKRAPKTKLETLILPTLFDNPGSTAKDVEKLAGRKIQGLYFFEGQKQGLLRVSGTRKNPNAQPGSDAEFGRGRPANEWNLTDKARKRVKRERAQATDKAAE